MEVFIEVVGWIGVVLILSSYALLSLEKLGPKSPIYPWMNVVGAAGFIINSGAKGAVPSAALNVIWMGIGFYALWKMRAAR